MAKKDFSTWFIERAMGSFLGFLGGAVIAELSGISIFYFVGIVIGWLYANHIADN